MKYFTLDQYPAKRTQHYCSYWANNPPPLLLARKHTAKNFEEKLEINMEKQILVAWVWWLCTFLKQKLSLSWKSGGEMPRCSIVVG